MLTVSGTIKPLVCTINVNESPSIVERDLFTIENSKGKITGKIEMANLIEGMKRPKSQGTNITG